MQIPKRNIVTCHEYDESDVSYQMYRAAFYGRNGRVVERVAVAMEKILPLCGYLINADLLSLPIARILSAATDIPLIVKTDINGAILKNAQVCIIAARDTDAREAYAALTMRFPLKIWVAAFLGK